MKSDDTLPHMVKRNQTTLDETITIPVDKTLLGAVRELADGERRKLAPMTRILIEEAVEARTGRKAYQPRPAPRTQELASTVPNSLQT